MVAVLPLGEELSPLHALQVRLDAQVAFEVAPDGITASSANW